LDEVIAGQRFLTSVDGNFPTHTPARLATLNVK
jgi:hypothetical protein